MQRLRPVSISHPEHFVNVARRRAGAEEGAVFANQFENLANFRAHLDTGETMLPRSIRHRFLYKGLGFEVESLWIRRTCGASVQPRR